MGRRIGLGVEIETPQKEDIEAVKKLTVENETLNKDLDEAYLKIHTLTAQIEGMAKVDEKLTAEVADSKKASK